MSKYLIGPGEAYSSLCSSDGGYISASTQVRSAATMSMSSTSSMARHEHAVRTASLRSSTRSSSVSGTAPCLVAVMVPSGWSVDAASLRTKAISKKASMMTASMGEHEKPIGTPSQ